jgi:hypothetical protein
VSGFAIGSRLGARPTGPVGREQAGRDRVPVVARDGERARARLPYLLRTRAILVFNDHLDYFPLHVARLRALAHHLSGGAEVRAALPWLLGRLILVPLATLTLLVSTARLYARAAWRSRRA